MLNKIGCLDKGFVALVSSHNSGETLKHLSNELMMPMDKLSLTDLSAATFIIRAPLFLQLNLSKLDLKIRSLPTSSSTTKPEAFLPDLTDVRGSDSQVAADIADDIARTTEALLINPKAYVHDGCDRFISQVLTPISVYNDLIVDGSLAQWIKFVQQENAPRPIQAYQNAVRDILNNEWKDLNLR